MFEKNMRISYLLDFYGDALDEHILGVMKAYYNDDLSLSEIAADVGISRQGIRHLIKKGEEELEFFDSKFSLIARHEELEGACRSLTAVRTSLHADERYSKEIELLDEAIGIILKGN